VKVCLKKEKMIRTPYPDLADEHTTHEKRIWEFKMTEILKTERVLEGNLRNLFTILMSLCDGETKHQVESSPEFNDLEETLDSMGLLALIKKLVYTGGANNKNPRHTEPDQRRKRHCAQECVGKIKSLNSNSNLK